MEIVLGIGTNLGDRLKYINQAVSYLLKRKVISNITISRVYESLALLPEDAPESWNQNFLNIAVKGETQHSPEKLLEEVKSIESDLGRQDRGFWSPREIDIDILIFGQQNIISENLIIPHQYLLERSFVLLPLNDIWPEWEYSRTGIFKGKKISELIKNNPIDTKECWVINELIEND